MAVTVAMAVAVAPRAAHADATPFPVLPADPLANFTETKSIPASAAQLVAVDDNSNFTQALQIAVPNGPTSMGLDGEYEITLGVLTSAAVTANDALVADLWVRSVQPVAGTTSGVAHALFENDGGSYTKSMNAALQFGSDWQHFTFPFRAAINEPAGGAHLNLWLGYGVQTLQVAGVSVTDYGPGNPAGYPAVTYDGRDPDAAWRTAANARIDQYRKGNLDVRVIQPDGKPVKDATVTVAQQTSAFHFGAASDAASLVGNRLSASDTSHYQQAVTAPFNQGTLANDLKWNDWENQTQRDTDTYPALEWMQGQDLRVRGHNLVWPSWGNMPPDVQRLAGDPAALRARIDNHITDEVSSVGDMVAEWDVVNEPYSDHNALDVLGTGELGSWFRLAHQANPDAQLTLNDYGILEDGGLEARHRDFDYNLVKSMKASGVPIDNVGMESHFNGLQLTPPDQLLSYVDQFAGLGVKVAVTEFDVATTDQQLQADYTRDFLTAMFSDPNVSEISNFGVWAGGIYDTRVALYNNDWSPKPNALVWQDLIEHQWRTNTSGATGTNGKYDVRGFLGDYLLNVTVNGVTKQVPVSMPTTDGASVTVVADGIGTTVPTRLDNPVGDGGFEHGTNGWVPLGVGPGTTGDAHSGSGALALPAGAGVTQNVRGLTAGTSYTLSGWATLTGPGAQCYVGVRGGVSGNTPTFQYELSYADERAFTQKLLAFTPPTGTGWAQVFAWSNPATGPASCHVDDITLTPTVGIPPPAQAPPAITPKLPTPSTLANGTMENQTTTNGWYCLGSCALKNSAATPHSGGGDLSAGNREAPWAGPAQGVSITNGAVYASSAWVRLAAPGTDTALISLKLTTSTDTLTFRFGSATVTGDGWTQLSASDVRVAYPGTLQRAEWWISTVNGAEDLLVDDVSFAPRAPVVAGQDVLSDGDVEQGLAGAWYCFAPCTAQDATDQAHGGTNSVRTTNRGFNYTGPAQGVSVTNGATYKSTAWVRMVDGAADTTAEIRLKLTMSDGSAINYTLASAAVSSSGWTQLRGTGTRVSWTGTLAKAEWWVDTTTGADDFYLDDAALQPDGVEQTAFNPVQPTAPCVVHSEYKDTWTAYFGYTNPNDFQIPVVTGSANAVSPAPADRGQPQLFLPYQRPKRFVVTSDGAPVTWQINGYPQTASSQSPSC